MKVNITQEGEVTKEIVIEGTGEYIPCFPVTCIGTYKHIHAQTYYKEID